MPWGRDGGSANRAGTRHVGPIYRGSRPPATVAPLRPDPSVPGQMAPSRCESLTSAPCAMPRRAMGRPVPRETWPIADRPATLLLSVQAVPSGHNHAPPGPKESRWAQVLTPAITAGVKSRVPGTRECARSAPETLAPTRRTQHAGGTTHRHAIPAARPEPWQFSLPVGCPQYATPSADAAIAGTGWCHQGT